jgi:heme/copper-type cytochrome/quinol oxidase subunit 2
MKLWRNRVHNSHQGIKATTMMTMMITLLVKTMMTMNAVRRRGKEKVQPKSKYSKPSLISNLTGASKK